MTTATVTQNKIQLAAPWTLATFFTNLKSAISTAFPSTATLYDDQSGTGTVVYQLTGDTTKVKKYCYLVITATLNSSTVTVTQYLCDAWNTSTHAVAGAGAGGASGFQSTLNINNALNFSTVNHPEMYLVIIDQGVNVCNVVGFLRPNTKDVDWDENSCPFFFIPQNETLQYWYPCNYQIVPFTNASYYFPLSPLTGFQNVNPKSGNPKLKQGPDLFSPSNEGTCGTLSSAIAQGGISGYKRFNVFTVGASQYTALAANSNTYSVLIQTA